MRAKGNVGSGAFKQDPGDEKCKVFYQGHRFAGSNQLAAAHVIHCRFNSAYESKIRNKVISCFDNGKNGVSDAQLRVRIYGKPILTD
jgi:hypothetical protein